MNPLIRSWLRPCLLLLLPLAGIAADPLRVKSVQPAPELDALFNRTQGWIGADGDYSVSMNAERTLWFFSDSFVGEVADGKRTKAAFINNSVGVQTVGAEGSKLDFFWGKNVSGKPTSLFAPKDGQGWFWPFGGVASGEKLELFLWQMDKAEGAPAFGFKNIGVWLGEIENPQQAPTKWHVTQRPLPFTEISAKRKLLFGSAVLRRDSMVYVYGIEEHPADKAFGKKMVLARVEADAVGDFERWRFWGADGWEKDFKNVVPITTGVAAEYSVTWVPALERYVMVSHATMLSPKIIARVASEPMGPWSAPVTLYTCPETAWAKGVFCYSGKAHDALSKNGELVISYAANGGQLSDVMNDARLYWPRFLRVQLERGK